MKNAPLIARKEIRDTLRDRRTLIVMLLIPLVVFPLLINIVAKMTISQKREAREKALAVALVRQENARDFIDVIGNPQDISFAEWNESGDIETRLREGDVDFVLVFDAEFDRRIAASKPARIDLHYISSEEAEITRPRVLGLLDRYRKDRVSRRFAALDIDPDITEVLDVRERDHASIKEKIGEAIGGFIPYIVVIFCFIGAMYPAIDLAAGEKERGTIETLLASPATRLEIVIGKFTVVFLAAIGTGLISLVGIYLSIQGTREIPPELMKALIQVISVESMLLFLSLLIPLSIFFAAVLLSISIFAHSFKEAQSIMTPMNFLILIPVLIGLFPGIKLNTLTAMVPILNVSLATRQIVSGTIPPLLLLEVWISLFLLAALSLVFCARWFQREGVIFRGS